MALITSNKITVTPASGQGASGWLGVIEDSRTTSNTGITITGHINLYMSKVTTSGSATTSNSGSTITTSKGTVTKSLSNKSVTCGSSSKSGYVQIGTFTITIPKGTVSQTVTISISSSVTVNYTSYSQSTTGTVTGSTTVSVPALQSYAVTYNNNNGTGTTQSQTKYYNVALSLNYTNPSLSGYDFIGWATSEANASAGTYSGTYVRGYSYTSNAALTLYGTYELAYQTPAINNLTVERCLSDGTPDDEGLYALVSFDWSVFTSNDPRYYGGNTTPYSSNTVDTCTITVGTETATPTLSGSSGSESVTVGSGNFSVDTEYSASVAITDTQTIVSPHTTTVTGALPTSSFPMDVNANGTAVALLRPAPDNDAGVFIGDDLDVGGDVTATGDIMAVGMAGMIQMFAGSAAPTGWLICDGSAVSRTTYAKLFSVIGTTYGTGDGSTTFNLPDLRGRMPLGSSNSHILGSDGGSEYLQNHAHSGSYTRPTVSSSGAITDGITGGSHSHNTYYQTVNRGSGSTSTRVGPYGSNYTAITTNSTTHTHNLPNHTHTLTGGGYTVNGVQSTSHTAMTTGDAGNMPPFLTINYIIATGNTA